MDWNDIDQKRLYYRNYARQKRGGIKKHPYKLDDGTRYLDTFQTKEEVKIPCIICDKIFKQCKYEKHIQTKTHLINEFTKKIISNEYNQ
jgi:hypothetical protein